MKYSTHLICSLFIVSSCTIFEGKEVGTCDDNINPSSRELYIAASGETISITTQRSGWWIDSITLNDSTLRDINYLSTTDNQFMIEKEEFSLERTSDSEFDISMTANPSQSLRILTISLQLANCFDYVRVTQEGD